MALFLPVDGKRIEVFVLEIHHREEFVHQTALEPALCILADLRICIPAKAPVSAQVIILSYRWAAHFYPRLFSLHCIVNLSYDVGDIPASLFSAHFDVPGFRVTDVVEVNTVYIIFMGDFPADVCQIITCPTVFRIHVSVGSNLLDEFRHLLSEGFAAECVPFSYRDGYHPRMQFHTALMAFVDGKLQGIIARTSARKTWQASIPRLVCRRINHGTSYAGLYQYGVDFSLL